MLATYVWDYVLPHHETRFVDISTAARSYAIRVYSDLNAQAFPQVSRLSNHITRKSIRSEWKREKNEAHKGQHLVTYGQFYLWLQMNRK